MKAKVYAKKVTACPTRHEAKEKVIEVGREFVREFIALRNQRKITTNAAVVSLIHEFDNKFRTFAVIVNTSHWRFKDLVAPFGFTELIKAQWPAIYDIYIKS